MFHTITRASSYARHCGIDKLDWRIKDEFSKVFDFFTNTILASIKMHSEYVCGKPEVNDTDDAS